jgi:hypothetical protein
VTDAVAYNGLTLDSDERLLAGVLAGSVSSVELAEKNLKVPEFW